MAAPLGNQNAKKAKKFSQALERYLERVDREALDKVAAKLFEKAIEGNDSSIKELIDRMDGKAVQAIVGGDENDNPIQFTGTIKLLKPE